MKVIPFFIMFEENKPTVNNMKINELFETVVDYQKTNRVFFQNSANWDVRRFREMYEDGELILKDWFQRDYCWNKEQVSALVHTLLNTPTLLPEVVLIEIDGKYYVADGHQRLYSLIVKVFKTPTFKYYSKELTRMTKYYNISPEDKTWNTFVRELERQTITVKVIKNNDLNEEELRYLKAYVFRKWNNGSAITTAEKRGANPSELNINIVQYLVKNTDEGTQKSLLVTNKLGRNVFNEFIEKMFYHYVTPDATRDPKKEEFDYAHSLDVTQYINKFITLFKKMGEVVNNYTEKNGKFWSSSSLRDVLTFVNSLYVKGKLKNLTMYGEYLTSVLDTIHRTYIMNNSFSAYQKGDIENINMEINNFWFKGYYSYFGKGQDSKFKSRREFLVKNMNDLGSLDNLDTQRLFNRYQKQYKYIQQDKKCCGINGVCTHTSGEVNIGELQADHILEYSKGGTTTLDNLQMLCINCHKEKTKELLSNNVVTTLD